MRGEEKTQDDIYTYKSVSRIQPWFSRDPSFRAVVLEGVGLRDIFPIANACFHSNEKNRFAAYLERKWRWIPICKYPSRYDFSIAYKQKKKKKKKKKINPGRISIEPTKKIIQSPGEFDTSRIAIFNSAIHSTCTALNFADSCRWSRCKTAKYRKPRHPAETRQRGKSGTEPRKRAETRYFNWKWLPLLAYRTHEIVV